MGGIFAQTDMMIILEITWGSLRCRKLNTVGFIKVFRSTIYLWALLSHDGIPCMKFSSTCRTPRAKPCQGSENSPEQCGVDTSPLLAGLQMVFKPGLLSPTVHPGRQRAWTSLSSPRLRLLLQETRPSPVLSNRGTDHICTSRPWTETYVPPCCQSDWWRRPFLPGRYNIDYRGHERQRTEILPQSLRRGSFWQHHNKDTHRRGCCQGPWWRWVGMGFTF